MSFIARAASLLSVVLTTLAVPAATAWGADQKADAVRVRMELPVTANDLRAPRAQNSPMLAMHPADPDLVALANRLDAPDFGCALHVSGDGGRLWVPAEPVPKLPRGVEKCYGPEVAFDGDGVLYYLFVGLHGRGNTPMGVFLTTSSDMGQAFSPPRRVLGPGNYQVRMAIDPGRGQHGRLYLVWLKTSQDAPLGGLPPPPNPILAAYSDDGGATFSDPVQVNGRDRLYAIAPGVAVGRDGAVHVVYYDLRNDVRDYQGLRGPTWDGEWSLVSSTSLDGGETFQPSAEIDAEVMPPERVLLIFTMPPPVVATDGEGGVYAAWHDARHGDWDVFFSRSVDSGRSWRGPIRLNDDALRSGRHQYLPQLSVAASGRIDAIFYDRRNDPDNIRNDVYYTFSMDRGATFASNVKLTKRSSNSTSGQRYLVPSAQRRADFGARIALASGDTKVMAAWTDTRNARFSPYQDVFATVVDVPSAGSARGWWAVIPVVAAMVVGALWLTDRLRARRRTPREALA